MQEIGHWINGKLVKGTSGRFADVMNPATGELQAKVALATQVVRRFEVDALRGMNHAEWDVKVDRELALAAERGASSGDKPAGTPADSARNADAIDSVAKTPYAWSVFDDKEHRGYLNLYDLPTVGTDQALQLWVKPIGSQEFVRVGQVPVEFYGKSGSVQYRLPETSSAPAEILITQEPRNTLNDQPTGATVLRGP